MTEKKFDETRIEERDDEKLQVEESKLRFEDKVVAKISKIAVNSIDGILDMKGNFFDSVTSVFSNQDQGTAGVAVEVGSKEAKVAMQIILEYGKNAPRIYEEIKRVVKKNVKDMTGLDVVTVNVVVVDVMTKKEYLAKNKDKDKENEERTEQGYQAFN